MELGHQYLEGVSLSIDKDDGHTHKRRPCFDNEVVCGTTIDQSIERVSKEDDLLVCAIASMACLRSILSQT